MRHENLVWLGWGISLFHSAPESVIDDCLLFQISLDNKFYSRAAGENMPPNYSHGRKCVSNYNPGTTNNQLTSTEWSIPVLLGPNVKMIYVITLLPSPSNHSHRLKSTQWGRKEPFRLLADEK
jgi:hypothetical protein